MLLPKAGLSTSWRFTLFLIPLYFWYDYIKTRKRENERDKAERIHYAKHNCVVMYCRGKGMSGWPAYEGRIALNLDNFAKFHEPITYFIDTAAHTLDIAVMILNVDIIFNCILAALGRNVQVRIILDYSSVNASKSIQKLQAKGAKVMCFMEEETDTIMHYKYAVKDYCEQTEAGYMLVGSLNWTNTGVLENYEDLVFTMKKSMVKAFHDNFEDTWDMLMKDSNSYLEEDLYNYL